MNNPVSYVYNEIHCKTRLEFRPFWVRESRPSENVLAKNCYVYRSTPLYRYKTLTTFQTDASRLENYCSPMIRERQFMA